MTATKSPAEAGTTWDAKLRAPFPADQLEYKPMDGSICRACKDSQDRVCGRHEKRECETCHQYMTTAHRHLTYVGHAGITMRLLEVDPRWTWEFAHRDVDPEVLKAAAATGDPEVVRLVIANAPPLPGSNNGLWINLTVHDDDGNPVTRPGFGDAAGKTGPNAVKELIGDALRNASMRFGVATYLWSKSDAAAEEKGERQFTPAARPAEDRPPGDGNGQPRQRKEPEVVKGSPGQAAAQELAKLAVQIAATGTLDDLEEKVQHPARRKTILTMPVSDPFSDGSQIVQLNKVIAEARKRIETDARDNPGIQPERGSYDD